MATLINSKTVKSDEQKQTNIGRYLYDSDNLLEANFVGILAPNERISTRKNYNSAVAWSGVKNVVMTPNSIHGIKAEPVKVKGETYYTFSY